MTPAAMLLLFLLGNWPPPIFTPVLRSVVTPTYAQLAVGQTLVVNVSGSIGDGQPYVYRATYGTAGPIEVSSVTDREYSQDVVIHALAPGRGVLTAPGGAQVLVDISTCDEGVRVTAPSIVSGIVGEYADLRASGSPAGGSFQWYTGRVGDISNPLKYGAFADYNVIPKTNGTTLFWVRYTTVCGYADAAVALQTGPAPVRQRAARH